MDVKENEKNSFDVYQHDLSLLKEIQFQSAENCKKAHEKKIYGVNLHLQHNFMKRTALQVEAQGFIEIFLQGKELNITQALAFQNGMLDIIERHLSTIFSFDEFKNYLGVNDNIFQGVVPFPFKIVYYPLCCNKHINMQKKTCVPKEHVWMYTILDDGLIFTSTVSVSTLTVFKKMRPAFYI